MKKPVLQRQVPSVQLLFTTASLQSVSTAHVASPIFRIMHCVPSPFALKPVLQKQEPDVQLLFRTASEQSESSEHVASPILPEIEIEILSSLFIQGGFAFRYSNRLLFMFS
jgi:hypothetical protein